MISKLPMLMLLALGVTVCGTAPEVIVYGFPEADSNTSSWLQWDWKGITTVVLIHTPPPGLVSFAHHHNVKVMQNVGLSKKEVYSPVTNRTARTAWIQAQLATASAFDFDGISIDIEANTAANRADMTEFVGDVSSAFRATLRPNATVLFSVTMYPYANYSKASPAVFDYQGIAAHVDFFFVMAYDTFGHPSTARGGGSLPEVAAGVREYVRLGVLPSKLVVGVGLFGFDFECNGVVDAGGGAPVLRDPQHHRYPHRVRHRQQELVPPGVGKCSTTLHSTRTPDSIPNVAFPGPTTATLSRLAAELSWDPISSQPYFNYKPNNSTPLTTTAGVTRERGGGMAPEEGGDKDGADGGAFDGSWHQVWYESAESIALKRGLVASMQLGGIGAFLGDFISVENERTVGIWHALTGATQSLLVVHTPVA